MKCRKLRNLYSITFCPFMRRPSPFPHQQASEDGSSTFRFNFRQEAGLIFSGVIVYNLLLIKLLTNMSWTTAGVVWRIRKRQRAFGPFVTSPTLRPPISEPTRKRGDKTNREMAGKCIQIQAVVTSMEGCEKGTGIASRSRCWHDRRNQEELFRKDNSIWKVPWLPFGSQTGR